MILRKLLLSILMFTFVSGSALAADADKAKKQAEIKKAAQTAMERFYKAKPELKGQVAKAPGYAVFTTFGISFLIGGAGGSGITHDNTSKKVTYMKMAQASAGAQIGASQSETLIVFKSGKALAQFVDKGWEFGGGGAVEAGAGGKTAGLPDAGGENVIAESVYYTLTKNGVQIGGAVAGTKFWKDSDLN
jgi:lipid-binding SYLF domain-containing protein